MKPFLTENRKRARRCAYIASCFAAASCLLFTSACTKTPDENAQKLFDEGVAFYNKFDMNEAKRVFASSNIPEAKDYLRSIAEYEKLYAQGVEAYSNGNFTEAASIFGGIKDYLNSADYLESIEGMKSEYAEGVRLYDEGQYLDARKTLLSVRGYAESENYLSNIDEMIERYNEAIERINIGDYQNALNALRSIHTDFEASSELISRLEEQLKKHIVTLGTFVRNYDAEFDTKGIEALHSDLLFYMIDTNGAWISGAMDENGVVRYISLYLTKEQLVSLGEAGVNSLAAHFVHALDPDYEEILPLTNELSSHANGEKWRYSSLLIKVEPTEYGGLTVVAEYAPEN